MSNFLNRRNLPVIAFLGVFSVFCTMGNIAYSQFDFGGNPSVENDSEKENQKSTPRGKKPSSVQSSPSASAIRIGNGKNGPTYGNAATRCWETGVKLTAVDRCVDMFFLIPIPMDWPEQTVRILEEKTTTKEARIERRMHPNGGLQEMVVRVPRLERGKTTEASLVVEVTRREILPPSRESTTKLSIPAQNQLPRKEFEPYLKSSPEIESDKKIFKELFQQITEEIDSDWDKIEAIYRYVQDAIVYDDINKAGAGIGAVETLRRKRGDCKDMTAVFIAICRAGKIPARTVRIPEHCYCEFFLVDDENIGYWFPCQVSGSYAFGGIPETKPVLQKGDNFTFKELPREKFRFVGNKVKGESVGRDPKCEFFERDVDRL